MMTQVFRVHGEFCATHPWEVIVAVLTITTCMLTMEHRYPAPIPKPPIRDCASCIHEVEYHAADMIVMTVIRCLAVLYTYYQFCNLSRLGSKYILGIAGFFSVVSNFILTSAVVNFLRIDISDLRDALFFFLLLIDLSKTGTLAQFALSGSHQEVKNNIARGMSVLGPTITLDTVVETLVIGVGTLSGVHRLETLSYIACLSVMINYVVFMTFYPACLSLTLELSRTTNICERRSMSRCLISITPKEEDQKSNPVVQRVKLIMAVGLMLVHMHSRWSFWENDVSTADSFNIDQYMGLNRTKDFSLHNYIMKWIALSSDHIVILILLLALVAKFVLFEYKDTLDNRHVQIVKHESKCLVNNSTQTSSAQLSLSPLINTLTIKSSFSLDQDSDEKHYENKQIQTDFVYTESDDESSRAESAVVRNLTDCLKIYRSNLGAATLTDKEVVMLVEQKYIASYQIEKAVDSPNRGVKIRRRVFASLDNFASALKNLPYKNYDYSKVMGACCENVIGYMPIPVGIVGPLFLDNNTYYIPMATTEGCLIASTNRGSRALLKCGITSRVVGDGMTRGPVVRFPSITDASDAMSWMECPLNFLLIKESFDSSSRYARLTKIHIRIAGRYLFIRFVAKTGDAMGMNMLSKGTELSLKMIQSYFPNMEILSLSGNFCADKKPAAINWIEGRGKSVVCEAVVPANVVTSVLKTTVHALVDVNISKNMIGSAIAGSIGGFNAHAANIVTAIFIATGQDPAQTVGSSNCMTIMEPWGELGEDLYISCTMPSIEIGTIGGGTVLPAQSACLEILGVKGPNEKSPGENACRLARIICGAVLAGELSLMAALTAGHLVKSHLRHNRSSAAIFSDFESNFRVPSQKEEI